MKFSLYLFVTSVLLLNKVQAQSDSIKIKLLLDKSFEYIDVNNVLSLKYADSAYVSAHKIGDSLRIVQAGRFKGQLLRRLENNNAALNCFMNILPIAKRNNYNRELKIILNGLGIIHTLRAVYDSALQYHLQSLQIREQEGDKFEISTALFNLGLVYYKFKNYNNAIVYYRKAILLRQEISNYEEFEALLINLSLCYIFTGDLDKAQSNLEKSRSFCDKNCSVETEMEADFAQGIIFFKLKIYSTSG